MISYFLESTRLFLRCRKFYYVSLSLLRLHSLIAVIKNIFHGSLNLSDPHGSISSPFGPFIQSFLYVLGVFYQDSIIGNSLSLSLFHSVIINIRKISSTFSRGPFRLSHKYQLQTNRSIRHFVNYLIEISLIHSHAIS